MINAVQQCYATQQTVAAVSRKSGLDSSRAVSSSDSVSLSGSGRLVADFFAGLGVDYAPGKAVSLADLKNGLQQEQKAFEDNARQALLKAGIPLDPPAVLASDETGAVRVRGDHPYKEQIEALFAADPELSGEFNKVSGLSSLVDAGNEYVEFSKKYAQDPYAAVAEYAHLIDRKGGQGIAEEEFTLTIGPSRDQAAGPGEVEPGSDRLMGPHAPADFTNMTRKGLVDWVNEEITSGRMSLDESSAFIGMTIKIDVETGATVPWETDTERIDFIERAQQGLEGALWRNDRKDAERCRAMLEIMRNGNVPSDTA